MKLINTTTYLLSEFLDDSIPTYAILSHRWQEDEVSYQDIVAGKAREKKGWMKILECCKKAQMEGKEWLWVDTCCIDKNSSAELSESINSMYRWYAGAGTCYVYLFDVHTEDVHVDDSFAESDWWRRGWTLQELLAPSHISFYNSSWVELGTKYTLLQNIAKISGIDENSLIGIKTEVSIAKRMSWASKRKTTRVEDMAYCLLGLFEVNMPLLYGEGVRAFTRLQEEIMKHSDDHSLFAWSSEDACNRGLLAKSPANFEGCSNIVLSKNSLNRCPYSVTNMGLSIELLMVGWAMETYLAALDCEFENIPDSRIGIFLRLSPKSKTDQCVRVRLGKDREVFPSHLVAKSQYRKIYVRQSAWNWCFEEDRMYGFWIRKLPINVKVTAGWGDEYRLMEVHSRNEWSQKERLLKLPIGSWGTAGTIWWDSNDGYSALKLGFDHSFNPVCQFIGPLWGPTNIMVYPERGHIERKMGNDWITKPFPSGAGWFYKGEIMSGLNGADDTHQICVNRETINGQPLWVVDVTRQRTESFTFEDDDGTNRCILCDGCNAEIVDKRFKCTICDDFDYCEYCNNSAATTHASLASQFYFPPSNTIWVRGHAFQLIRSLVKKYMCNKCGKRDSENDERWYSCKTCPGYALCEDCHEEAAAIHPFHTFDTIEYEKPATA